VSRAHFGRGSPVICLSVSARAKRVFFFIAFATTPTRFSAGLVSAAAADDDRVAKPTRNETVYRAIPFWFRVHADSAANKTVRRDGYGRPARFVVFGSENLAVGDRGERTSRGVRPHACIAIDSSVSRVRVEIAERGKKSLRNVMPPRRPVTIVTDITYGTQSNRSYARVVRESVDGRNGSTGVEFFSVLLNYKSENTVPSNCRARDTIVRRTLANTCTRSRKSKRVSNWYKVNVTRRGRDGRPENFTRTNGRGDIPERAQSEEDRTAFLVSSSCRSEEGFFFRRHRIDRMCFGSSEACTDRTRALVGDGSSCPVGCSKASLRRKPADPRCAKCNQLHTLTNTNVYRRSFE